MGTGTFNPFSVSKDGATFYKKTKDTKRVEDYKSQGTLLSSGKSLEVDAKENINMQNVDMKANKWGQAPLI